MKSHTARFPIYLFSLGLSINVLAGSGVEASSYYSVTSFGSDNIQILSDPNRQQYIQDSTTATSYAFPNTAMNGGQGAGEMWSSEQAYKQELGINALPGYYGIQGAEHPEQVYFTMSIMASNSRGTVVGGFPNGESLAMPYMFQSLGYTERQTDGSYGPFHSLFGAGISGGVLLNGTNQILVLSENPIGPFPSQSGEGSLLDLNTGSNKAISQLLSPDSLKLYLQPPSPFGLADNGSILAGATLLDGQRVTLLLTPPDVTTPQPVPEPTPMITMFAIIGLVFYQKLRGNNVRGLPRAA